MRNENNLQINCGIFLQTEYRCTNCSYKSDRRANLERHQKTCGKTPPHSKECPRCKRVFVSTVTLKRHIEKAKYCNIDMTENTRRYSKWNVYLEFFASEKTKTKFFSEVAVSRISYQSCFTNLSNG